MHAFACCNATHSAGKVLEKSHGFKVKIRGLGHHDTGDSKRIKNIQHIHIYMMYIYIYTHIIYIYILYLYTSYCYRCRKMEA